MSTYHAEYYKAHKEKILANSKKWQESHREQFLEILRKNAANWRLENEEYRKQWNRLYNKKRRAMKNGNQLLVAELTIALAKIQEDHSKQTKRKKR